MIKEELPDSRRFQLMRLRTYISIKDDFIKQIQLIPQWDRENVRQLIQVLDQSIDGEIERLICGKFRCNKCYGFEGKIHSIFYGNPVVKKIKIENGGKRHDDDNC